mmetsp:Transcript_38625/g.111465  ORF Transcript_38625/g.111465 Transcript_38625/m.111465 type:complete len:215 (-) Transcript_38625:1367-2011(-)
MDLVPHSAEGMPGGDRQPRKPGARRHHPNGLDVERLVASLRRLAVLLRRAQLLHLVHVRRARSIELLQRRVNSVRAAGCIDEHQAVRAYKWRVAELLVVAQGDRRCLRHDYLREDILQNVGYVPNLVHGSNLETGTCSQVGLDRNGPRRPSLQPVVTQHVFGRLAVRHSELGELGPCVRDALHLHELVRDGAAQWPRGGSDDENPRPACARIPP